MSRIARHRRDERQRYAFAPSAAYFPASRRLLRGGRTSDASLLFDGAEAFRQERAPQWAAVYPRRPLRSSPVAPFRFSARAARPLQFRFGVAEHFASPRTLPLKVPSRVRFCVQRKERRQVLFALERAGYRGSAPKRHYQRTQESQYRC